MYKNISLVPSSTWTVAPNTPPSRGSRGRRPLALPAQGPPEAMLHQDRDVYRRLVSVAEDEKELDQQLAQVFQKRKDSLPADKYFTSIWHGIESRAPVGRAYYLRSFFAIFLAGLFLLGFILFYSEFLTTVLTLKEMHQHNVKMRNQSFSLVSSPVESLKPPHHFKVAEGIEVTAVEPSEIRLHVEDAGVVMLDVFKGHMVINKTSPDRVLIVHLPDLKVRLKQGTCNLFCYDGMVRVIPLAHALEVELGAGQSTQTVNPGETFYLLENKRTLVVKGE